MSKYESLADVEAAGYELSVRQTTSPNINEQWLATLQRYTSGTFHRGRPMEAMRPVRHFGEGATEEAAIAKAVERASAHETHIERINAA